MSRTGLKSEWKRGLKSLLFCCKNSTGSKQRLEEIRFAQKSYKNFTSTPGLSYQLTVSDGARFRLQMGLKRASEQTSVGLWGG